MMMKMISILENDRSVPISRDISCDLYLAVYQVMLHDDDAADDADNDDDDDDDDDIYDDDDND